MTDPTPWLAERYRRQIEQQKLPLQLQSMALQNQASQLDIEHQGMQNDLAHQELNNYAEDQPVLKDYLDQASKTPGGALTLPVPAFKSKAAMAAVANRQKADLSTSYAESRHQVILDQGKMISAAMPFTGKVYEPRPDGTFAPQDLMEARDALESERQKKQAETEKLWGIRTAFRWATDPLTGEQIPVPLAVAEEKARSPGQLSATGKNDALITDYETKRDAAIAAGNSTEAQRIQSHIDYIKGQHRNPLIDAKLGSLKSEKAKVFEMMLNSKPGSAKYNEYKAQYEAKEAEMEQAVRESSTLAPIPAAGASTNAPSQTLDIGRFKVQVH